MKPLVQSWLTGEENPAETGIIIQGITGKFGRFHTKLMLEYGTKIIAGVTPGKGGATVDGIRVYDTVKEATERTGAKVSIMFVPAAHFLTAAKDALNADISLIVAITEKVPIKDTILALKLARSKGASIIGPNCPGIIIPNKIKLGIMPANSFKEGPVAIFSRSGTLMYEASYHILHQGLGQTVAMGIGGDPINCTSLIDGLEWIRGSDATKALVIVGEIGGDTEEKLIEYAKKTNFRKPIIGYIVGRYAPKETKMGHAGAIIYGSYGTAESKIRSFTESGYPVAMSSSQIPDLVKKELATSR
ncbi:MAG: CoA-binding protein [Thaumarchaeota archaeon]|nr:CoA-binding protein [Nitrososphaerota archaeon]